MLMSMLKFNSFILLTVILSMLMLIIMSLMEELILKVFDSYHNVQLKYDNLSMLMPMLMLMMSLLMARLMAMLFVTMLITIAIMRELILKI